MKLEPYYSEFDIDIANIPAGLGRAPFSEEIADVVEPFRPPVVSFHFGLPSARLLRRAKGWGAVVLASATTVAEACWLDANGADAVIAQGFEAGGQRGIFLPEHLSGDWQRDLSTQIGTFALVP